MVRQTKPLSGGAKDKFLRGLVNATDGVPEGARVSLSTALTQAITEVRVRREAYERVRDQPELVLAAPSPRATLTAPPFLEPVVALTPTAFDPFAFSVVAVLTKKGKQALLEALGGIESVDNLRRIGDAQHLALDPALVAAVDLRAAIVSGAEQRIAERKAAAS